MRTHTHTNTYAQTHTQTQQKNTHTHTHTHCTYSPSLVLRSFKQFQLYLFTRYIDEGGVNKITNEAQEGCVPWPVLRQIVFVCFTTPYRLLRLFGVR